MHIKRHTKMVHDVVIGGGHKIEALASGLDKAPSTLYNELNPYHEGTSKLGYDDALAIMLTLGNPKPLIDALAEHGLAALPIGDNHAPLLPDHAYQHMTKCLSSLGEVATTVAEAIKDGVLDKQEQLAIFEKVVGCIDDLKALGGKALAGAKR